MRAPQDEDEHRVSAQLTMSNSPSRSRGAFLRPGFATLLRSPESRGGRSAERRSGACEAPVGRALGASQDARRRLASHNAGRSPLGAPPWRFWASGPRFLFRHPPPLTLRRAWIRAASSSQPGRSAWRATSRASRGEQLRAARRKTPRHAPPRSAPLRSAFGIVSGDAPR